MKYYDVFYINPITNKIGCHKFVKADSKIDACDISAEQLSSGTIFTKEDFKIVKVSYSNEGHSKCLIT